MPLYYLYLLATQNQMSLLYISHKFTSKNTLRLCLPGQPPYDLWEPLCNMSYMKGSTFPLQLQSATCINDPKTTWHHVMVFLTFCRLLFYFSNISTSSLCLFSRPFCSSPVLHSLCIYVFPPHSSLVCVLVHRPCVYYSSPLSFDCQPLPFVFLLVISYFWNLARSFTKACFCFQSPYLHLDSSQSCYVTHDKPTRIFTEWLQFGYVEALKLLG